MKRLIACEFERIWRNRRTQLLLAFYILFILLSCVERSFIGRGAYDGLTYDVPFNTLNFAPFLFYEVRIELLFIILPILYITSISYEQSIGAFRMYVTRPYKKYEFIVSKLISLALTTLIFVYTTFILSTIFGFIFMPKASTVKFYNIEHEFSMIQALLYNISFYFIQFVIALTILALASVIGMLIKNSLISTLIVMAVSMGLGLRTKAFEFIFRTTKYGFYALGNAVNMNFYITLIGVLAVGTFISMVLWEKMDYLN